MMEASRLNSLATVNAEVVAYVDKENEGTENHCLDNEEQCVAENHENDHKNEEV
jgi:hypothetical protein